MRIDQYDQLKKLQYELADLVLSESTNIRAVEPKIAKTGKKNTYHNEERKLHWRKKNIMATLTILAKIQHIVMTFERAAKSGGNQTPGGRTLPRTVSEVIAKAEAEVARRATMVEPVRANDR